MINIDEVRKYFPKAETVISRYRQHDGSLGHPVTFCRLTPGGPALSESAVKVELTRAAVTRARQGASNGR